MVEGFTANEIADCADELQRRNNAFRKVPPVRPQPPWATLSGFSDYSDFSCALSRTWPVFPITGKDLLLLRIFYSPQPIILMDLAIAIPRHELFPY